MPPLDWIKEFNRLSGAVEAVPKTSPAARITVTPAPKVGEGWKPTGPQEPITAYHASPHDFEQFDMSKVGTGVGHNYLGEGMYFTKDQQKAEALRQQYFPEGKVYEAEISAPEDLMLDWRKRVGEQPEGVTKAVEGSGAELGGGVVPDFAKKNLTGKDAMQALLDVDVPTWRTLLNDYGIGSAQEGARKFLLEHGVPGATMDDTVLVFDDKLINILKKYGVAGAAVTGALASVGDEAKAQEKPTGPQQPLQAEQWKPTGPPQPLQADQWKPTGPSQPQESQWIPGAMMRGALRPFTSYPETYKHMEEEARTRMGEGIEQLGTSGSRMSGAWKLGTGALGYVTSPIDAAARTLIGQPLQDVAGIPREYTEFAATLALPIIGFGGSARGKDLMRPIEAVLSPNTLSADAKNAEAMLRASGGTAARDTAKTEAAVEAYHAKVNALPEVDRLNFIDYVEGRSGQYAGLTMRDPELQALANTLRTAFDQRMNKLQSLPSTSQMQFIEDYFPHFWKDPNAAVNAAKNFGGGASRQGSGASLKARTVPTVHDGIAMGLEPVTTNPLEASLRYIRSMDHFIASQEVLDVAKAQGTVQYIKPKVMGASGHPDSYKVPPGWVPIQGRGAVRPDGSMAHAPEDWARVYNNFIDRGIHKNADWGKVYDAAQSTSNAITGLELGLSGFHAFTMANEAFVSGIAKGVGEIAGGRPIKGVGSILTAPAKPITNYRGGKKIEQIYLGQTQGTPDMRKITDLLEKAGGRAVGKAHAPDYRFSPMGSYWTAFKRGALKQEMRESAANIKARPVVGTAKEATRMIGRTMETVAQPLFEKYIPRIKNGAFYDTMKSWLDLHPNASQAEQLSEARRIWDSIDNRFGEMVQDNIFWNKTLKQTAQLGMRSYSWNMGTIREIGGGMKDIVDTAAGRKEWSSRASYVVALPIAVGTLNAAYQYLMTGKAPESVDDLLAGRTGGTAPGFGGRGEVPERVSLPGYQKDVLGWYENWRQEAANKIATGPRAAVLDPLRDADWKGDPVFHAGHAGMEDYFTHVIGSMGPISVKQLMQGQKTGSQIGPWQGMMGIRPVGTALSDPEGHKLGMEHIQRAREMREKKGDVRRQRFYEQ